MKTFRLGDVTTKIGSGATPRGGEKVYTRSGVALIRSQNVYNDGFRWEGLVFLDDEHAEDLSQVEVKFGDVLLNITGDSVARACQVPNNVLPARVNQHVAIIRARPDMLDARFLRYFLITPSTQAHLLGLAGAGATRSALTKSMIQDLPIPALELSEQTAKAKILGKLDEKIELNRRTNETLETMARAIFKSWFVDFEPVRAKTEGRQPFCMDAATAALFPDSLEDSPLGKIPVGWTTRYLKEIAVRITKGTTPTTLGRSFTDLGINFVKAESISDTGQFLPERFAHIDEETNELLSRSVLDEGDIVYTIAGTIGRIARVPKDILPANTNQAVAIIRPNKEIVEANFVRLWLDLPHVKTDLLARVVHAVQPNLSLEMLGKVPIVFPRGDTMKRLFTHVGSLLEKVEANIRQSRTLASIRDALLPKLISGEIRVKDAEELAEKTA